MIPANEEKRNNSATRKMLTSIILVSFWSKKAEMIKAAKPVRDKKNRKNKEDFVN